MDKTFKTSKGFKVACWILAVVCIPFLVTIPFTLLMLWLAYGARVRVTEDKLVIRWFGTREHAWSDISSLKWVRAPGFIGGMMRPLGYELKSKPKATPRIAVGAHQDSDELVALIQQKTGLEAKAA